jgi:hypothetical protein
MRSTRFSTTRSSSPNREGESVACDGASPLIKTNGELSFVWLRAVPAARRHLTANRGDQPLIDEIDDASERRRTTALLMHHSFDLRQ